LAQSQSPLVVAAHSHRPHAAALLRVRSALCGENVGGLPDPSQWREH